jgi:UDP-glucose 4-epimerase
VRVLVTGGAGFIGSHVVDRLRAHGHEPRIFDLVASPHHPPGEVDTFVGDLLDPAAVRAALRDCAAVAHLAAVADVDRVVAEPDRAERVNVGGTRVLLESARAQGVGRVVYASTVWVYGDTNGAGPQDEDAPLPMPSHLYTATKLAGEMYCHAYGELFGVEHTVLRFGIPYGPRSRLAAVVAAFVARALDGEPLRIAGDGTQSRRFVYVEDLADGVVGALAPSAAGRVYNLVGDESVSINTIATMVRELVSEVPVVHVPGRPGDLYAAEISGVRAARELGWRATTTFAEGLRRYVAWVMETNEMSRAAAASKIAGSAATVLRHEPSEL